jgi:predicted flap endonuclease-1-like 5' DNA nuclease
MNIPCFLIPAIVGLICGILGYLLGKSSANGNNKTDVDSLKDDLETCLRRNSQLKYDIDQIRNNRKTNTKTNVNSLTERPIINKKIVSEEVPFDETAAKVVFGKKIKENDLKIIEGIGPKIEELFKTSGILTWKSLSETSVDRCKKILAKAGERYQIHDPGTWPRQSKLCHEGKWQELKDWQGILDGGKERK